jgi:hypothetical protein
MARMLSSRLKLIGLENQNLGGQFAFLLLLTFGSRLSESLFLPLSVADSPERGLIHADIGPLRRRFRSCPFLQRM